MDKIKGIIVPMVTPLLEQDVIDVEGAFRLVDRAVAGGVAALFLLGTTGEAQSLSVKTRYDFVELICGYVAGRIPVLVGVTETSISESLALAGHAKSCGAAGVVAAAPYYFAPSRLDMAAWFTSLADRSPLPVFLYNMPSHVKVFMDIPLVLELSGHPNIVGLKDSSANMTYFASLLHHFAGSEFALYMGPEEQTAAAVLLGADGGVNGGANMFPELYVGIYKAAEAGDLDSVNMLQDRILAVSTGLYGLGEGGSSYLCGLKCALEVLGVCSGYVSLPYRGLDDGKKAEVAECLKRLAL